MSVDAYTLPFTQVVQTARGPALLIGGEVVEIRSSDSQGHAIAICDALRSTRYGTTGCSNPISAPAVAATGMLSDEVGI